MKLMNLAGVSLLYAVISIGCSSKSGSESGNVQPDRPNHATSETPGSPDRAPESGSALPAPSDEGSPPPPSGDAQSTTEQPNQDPNPAAPGGADEQPASGQDDVVLPPAMPTGEQTFVNDAVGIAGKLKLTSEQRPRYDAVVAELRGLLGSEQRKATRERLSELREAVKQAQDLGDIDRMRTLREEIRALRNQREDFKPYVELFKRIDPILTPEQQSAARELHGGYLTKKLADDAIPQAMPEILLETAKKLDVNDEQRRQLSKLDSIFLPQLRRSRTIDQQEYRQLKLELKQAIAAVLSEEQNARFESELAALANTGKDDRPRIITADPRFMIEAARKMELNQMQRDNLQKVEEAFAELMKTVRPSTDRWRYRYLRRRVKTAVASVLEPEQIAQLEAAIEQRRAEHIKQGKNLEEFGDNDDEMTPPGEESPDGGGR